MSLLARLLTPLLDAAVARRIDAAVAQRLDEHVAGAPHVPPNDLLMHHLVYGDRSKLHLHPTAEVNNALFNLSSGEITIEEYAFFGHSVSVLTGTHDITKFDRDRQVGVPKSGRDVVIERGAWVSSNALVLGPSRIGRHAVVAAGSVVTGDVPPYTVVAGTPARPVKTVPRPGAPDAPAEPAADGPRRFPQIYPEFQDRFRGSADDVRERLGVHLPDIERVSSGRGVLDVGPGRGEWLRLLADHGVPAYGVEDNAEQAERIRCDGRLRVVVGDAVTHLQQAEPGSLDAVTAFHVVEHLDVDAALALLTAARRALRPGGCLLLETPHPENLVMAACNFYLDPTHLRPVPPALASFLVESAGFIDVEVRPLHRKETVDLTRLRLPDLDERARDLLTAALDKALFGPQDYALVATAPG